MATDRLLIDYLPPFVQEFQEIKKIMEVEQPEIDNLWESCGNALNDQFVLYATENGVRRWEKIMGIAPKDTDTIDERKFRILSKMNQELPYTLYKLKEALTTLCGANNFSINLQPEIYHIEVKLALSNANNYQDIVNLLKKMIPANLTQHVQIMYNGYKNFNGYTHSELRVKTHDELRSEVSN